MRKSARNGLLIIGVGMIAGALALPRADDGQAPSASRTLSLPPAAGVPADDTRPRGAASLPDAEALRERITPENTASQASSAERSSTGHSEAGTGSRPVARAPAEAAPEDTPEWRVETVRSGDNLAAVFKRAGLGPRDVHEVVNAGEPADQLTRIFPGDEIYLQLGADNELHGLRYAMSPSRTLHLRRTGDDDWQPHVERLELERRTVEAEGRIESSLYSAGMEAGLTDRLIMELAAIFGWDIDFALDLRRDDAFVVIYETLHRDGQRVRTGDILAAEFVNRGERFRAVRYETPEGESNYYTPQGRSMRKAFLRTPTDFTRVSSEFNPERVHPVYGTKRPHRGTDYAAPPGTPIKAAGDGKIIERGTKGGYGNTVVLKHGTRYTTLYAHMRRFASGQSVGERVKQGDIIGYVGSTGLSTGPHLHYEFRVDGTHRNPRTVDLPEAEPIDERYREDFEQTIAPLVARLDDERPTRVARVDQ
jgi:murein DD-endopeptidase MepM/ murein hydrolase activator NlpD